GEAICARCLGAIEKKAKSDAEGCKTATEKLRRLFRSVVEETVAILASDERIFELVSVATLERWPSAKTYMSALREDLCAIILLGRETGEFERKTPLDETCRVILQA